MNVVTVSILFLSTKLNGVIPNFCVMGLKDIKNYQVSKVKLISGR
jgi:hypothetical protein